jgi:hypothetical protein
MVGPVRVAGPTLASGRDNHRPLNESSRRAEIGPSDLQTPHVKRGLNNDNLVVSKWAL